jgi:hypothetical protein
VYRAAVAASSRAWPVERIDIVSDARADDMAANS